jgi:hypothetical protein
LQLLHGRTLLLQQQHLLLIIALVSSADVLDLRLLQVGFRSHLGAQARGRLLVLHGFQVQPAGAHILRSKVFML